MTISAELKTSTPINNRVYIESVRLKNFLSHAEGTIYLEPQYNVIVGHNGAGKSAIFQAVKFALGSNQRDERYPNWRSFIRDGTNEAEVEVILWTGEKRISIMRKITKNGLLYFYVDGRRVKASQVEELVSSMNINPDNPFMFISQGNVDLLGDLKPVAVRDIIEEGTGLQKFRIQINEEESRIADTKTRIDKLTADRKFIELKLDNLQESMKRLIKKRELKARIKKLERESIFSELEHFSNLYEDMKKELGELESSLEEIELRIKEISALIKEIDGQIIQLETRQKELSEKKGSIKSQIITLKEKMKQYKEEIKSLINENDSLVSENHDFEKEIKFLESKKKGNTQILKQLEAKIMGKRKELAHLQDSLDKIQEDMHKFLEWEKKRNAANKELQDAEYERKQIESKLKSKKDRIKTIEQYLKSIEADIGTVFKSITDLDDRELAKREIAIKDEIERLRIRQLNERSKLNDLEKRARNLREKLENLEDKIPEPIKKFQAELEKYQLESVKGPIITEISFDDSLATAIELLFDKRVLLGFVTTDENDFKLLHKIRAKAKADCCIFLLRGEPLPIPDTSIISKVEGPSEILAVLNDYMGEVQLVKTESTLLKTALKVEGKFISPMGRIIESRRTIIIDYPSMKEQGLISVSQIEKELKANEREQKKTNKAITKISQDIEKLNEEYSEIRFIRRQLPKIRSKLIQKEKYIAEIRNIRKEIEPLKEQLLQAEIKSEEKRKKLREIEQQIPEGFEKLERKKIRIEKQIEKIRITIRKLAKEIQDKESEIRVIENKIDLTTHKVMQNESRIKEIQQKLNSQNQYITELNDTIKGLETDLELITAELDKIDENIKSLNEQRVKNNNKSLEYKYSRDTKFKEHIIMLNQLSKWSHKIENLKEKIKRESLERPPKIMPYEEIIHEIERLNIELSTYDDVDESIEHKKLELAQELNRIDKLTSSLRNEISDALKALEKLREDYKRELTDVLFKIEYEVNDILSNVSFDGKIQLKIIEPESDNTDELGVQVSASIRDSPYKPLTAASGGQQTLVAFSLIIALQRFNFVPITFFDELDIYLDPAYTELVSQIIRNESKKTQFVVLTPGKSLRFLEHADKVIGVTNPRDVNVSIIINSPKIIETDSGIKILAEEQAGT